MLTYFGRYCDTFSGIRTGLKGWKAFELTASQYIWLACFRERSARKHCCGSPQGAPLRSLDHGFAYHPEGSSQSSIVIFQSGDLQWFVDVYFVSGLNAIKRTLKSKLLQHRIHHAASALLEIILIMLGYQSLDSCPFSAQDFAVHALWEILR